MSTAEQPPERLDARLVPAALLAWASVLLGILAGWQWSVAAGVSAVAAVPVVFRTNRRALAAGVFGCLAVTAAFSVATALRVHAVATHPMTAAAHDGASTTLRVRVADDPKPLASSIPGAAPQVRIPAELRSARGYRAVHGAVVLLAPAQGWAGLLPGQEVTLTGRLAPSQRADLTVCSVRVIGAPTEVSAPSWAQGAAGSLRSRLHEAAGRVLSAEPGALLPGLVVGDTSGISPELDQDFRTAGLTHLTAVSGTNVRARVLLSRVWKR